MSRLIPLLHLAIDGDGTIQDVTSLSAIDSFGIKAKITTHGKCDVVVYGTPKEDSAIDVLYRALGMIYPIGVKPYRYSYDTSPYSLQVMDPTSSKEWRRKRGIGWGNYRTEGKMKAWIAGNYFRAASFTGGNPDGQVQRSQRTNAARDEWFPIYYSSLKGIADIAARTLCVVIGDTDLLETAGLSYSDRTLDILQVLDLKEIISEYSSTFSEDYSDVMGGKNVPREIEGSETSHYATDFGMVHGRTLDKAISALKPVVSSFDTPYYHTKDLAEAYLLAQRLIHLKRAHYVYGYQSPFRDLAIKESLRLIHIMASSFDPIIDTRSFVCPAVEQKYIKYPAGTETIWNILRGRPEADLALSVLEKNLSLLRAFSKTFKRNSEVIYRTKSHTKLAERRYREHIQQSIMTKQAMNFEGFNKLHTDWAVPLRSILGSSDVPLLIMGESDTWDSSVAVIHHQYRKGDMGELLLSYCNLLKRYSSFSTASARSITLLPTTSRETWTAHNKPMAVARGVSPYCFGCVDSLLPRPDIGLHMEEILRGEHGLVDLTEDGLSMVKDSLGSILDGSIHDKLDSGDYSDFHMILIDMKDKGYY